MVCAIDACFVVVLYLVYVGVLLCLCYFICSDIVLFAWWNVTCYETFQVWAVGDLRWCFYDVIYVCFNECVLCVVCFCLVT